MVKISFLVLVLILPGLYAAKPKAKPKGESTLCFGTGYSYLLSAPKGWVLDIESGKSDGLCAVSYPKGSSWKNGDTVMYSSPTPKKEGNDVKTLEQMIAFDDEQHRTNLPAIKITDAPALTKDGKKVRVKHFTHEKNPTAYEAVAYLEEKDTVFFLVLTSKSKAGFEKYQSAFASFVHDFKFVTGNVQFK